MGSSFSWPISTTLALRRKQLFGQSKSRSVRFAFRKCNTPYSGTSTGWFWQWGNFKYDNIQAKFGLHVTFAIPILDGTKMKMMLMIAYGVLLLLRFTAPLFLLFTVLKNRVSSIEFFPFISCFLPFLCRSTRTANFCKFGCGWHLLWMSALEFLV